VAKLASQPDGRPYAGAYWEILPGVPVATSWPSKFGSGASLGRIVGIIKSRGHEGVLIVETGSKCRTIPASWSQSAAVSRLPVGSPVSLIIGSVGGHPVGLEVLPLRLA
jgi:hypothetical protein